MAVATTDGALEVAVQLHHILAASPLVQPIHVLGDQQEITVEVLLPVRQGIVGRVGLHLGHQPAAPLVPLPDCVRLPREGLRRGQFHGVVAGPQTTLCFSEGGYAALCGNSGAG